MNVSGQLHAPAALLPAQNIPCPLSGSQSWPGHIGEVIGVLTQPGTEPQFLGHPVRVLVTTVTELSRL